MFAKLNTAIKGFLWAINAPKRILTMGIMLTIGFECLLRHNSFLHPTHILRTIVTHIFIAILYHVGSSPFFQHHRVTFLSRQLITIFSTTILSPSYHHFVYHRNSSPLFHHHLHDHFVKLTHHHFSTTISSSFFHTLSWPPL